MFVGGDWLLHDSIRTWYLTGGGCPEEWPGFWRIGGRAIMSTQSLWSLRPLKAHSTATIGSSWVVHNSPQNMYGMAGALDKFFFCPY